MNVYLGFLRRRFLWAIAGLLVFLSYSWGWGDWFVRAMLSLTGLDGADPTRGPVTAGRWLGLVFGTLLVMAPAMLGFLAYMVAWIGWPGRAIPEPRKRWAGLGIGLAVAVTAFMLVGLVGYYWPVGRWRGGLHRYAAAVVDDEVPGSAWVGDMYYGLLLAAIGLYVVIIAAAILLPSHLGLVGWRKEQVAERAEVPPPDGAEPSGSSTSLTDAEAYYAAKPSLWETPRRDTSDEESGTATGAGIVETSASPGTTGIWWPYAAGAVVVIFSVVIALWPHLTV